MDFFVGKDTLLPALDSTVSLPFRSRTSGPLCGPLVAPIDSRLFFRKVNRLGILGGCNSKMVLELAGEMMNGRILQHFGDLGKVVFSLPDQLFALLQLGSTNVLPRRDLQIPLEECS